MAQIVPGNVLGGYRLVEQLGVGGMGEVWRAHNVRLERMERAVKVIRTDVAEAENYRARFLREAEVLEQLTHPNILHVFDLGEQDGVLFLTMELLHGMAVDQLLKNGPVPFDRILSIATQSLTGLAHAHSLGIIHRDIKPANLFIQDDGTVKVLDFGIARDGADNRAMTATGVTLGSPAYFAPEFADGAPASAASDIYSIGISLFELATGRLPFEASGSNAAQACISLLLQHASKPFPDLATLRAGVPPVLARAIARATAKQPGDRPTALSLLADLAHEAPPAAAVSVTATATAISKRPTTPNEPRKDSTAGLSPGKPRRSALWAVGGIAAALAVSVPFGLHFLGGVASTPPNAATPILTVLAIASATSPPATGTAFAPNPAPSRSPRLGQATHPRVTPVLTDPTVEPVPVASAATTAVAAAQTGSLAVRCDPWCQFSVDGGGLLETPLKPFPLGAGTHKLRFLNSEQPSPFQKDWTVEIPADGAVIVHVDVKTGAIHQE